ncbi:MAG: Clp protease N-terminal domain-containing protein [Capsulimonas sp.]|uniref:Clp protease N-terminal domain-containing protein n=1 Tax=Capsulimonas sp. TaxID=2494211 RepID=UPI003265CEBF
MWQRFSEAARKSVFHAQTCAANYGQQRVTLDHMMVGLLTDPGSAAAGIVLRLGASREELMNAVLARQEMGEYSGRDYQLSREMKSGVDRAYRIAGRLKHDYIGTEHLLAGILEQAEQHNDDRFLDAGLTLQRVVEDIENDGGVWPPAPKYEEAAPKKEPRPSLSPDSATASLGLAIVSTVFTICSLWPLRGNMQLTSVALPILLLDIYAITWAWKVRRNPKAMAAITIASLHSVAMIALLLHFV